MDYDAEISAKREQMSTLEREISELESQKASIGSGLSAANSTSTPKYHAFDYMQGEVQQWEEARAQIPDAAATIGACGCTSGSDPGSAPEQTQTAFMASEVEQWEKKMEEARRAADAKEKNDE